jgi:bacterioferritin-associated ferredoxin
MIICVCKAVSDRQIKNAVKGGATCIRDLARDLAVGTCCGKCVPEARRTLSRSLATQADTSATPTLISSAIEFAV